MEFGIEILQWLIHETDCREQKPPGIDRVFQMIKYPIENQEYCDVLYESPFYQISERCFVGKSLLSDTDLKRNLQVFTRIVGETFPFCEMGILKLEII